MDLQSRIAEQYPRVANVAAGNSLLRRLDEVTDPRVCANCQAPEERDTHRQLVIRRGFGG